MNDERRFGIYIPQVSLRYDEIVDRARLCEELGFDSFWLYDHLYTPGLPDNDAFEGWTLATAVLTATTRLRVGHLVVNNNLRHPALLGKMATTLDVISGGRLELGIGSGSYEPEHHEAGIAWGSARERAERLEETLEIVTRMFSGERTTFAGRHYQVRDLANRPPPVQQPRPPIHVGGVGERHTLPLVARFADVWNVPTYALDRWEQKSAVLDSLCEAAGRDPASIRRSVEAVLVLAPDDADLADAVGRAERRYPGPGWGLHEGGFVGTPAAVVDRIGQLAERGIDLFVFLPSDRGSEATLRLLAEEVMPHFSTPVRPGTA
ncbi:MAG TPA: LLM class flavin-dependent oxidoreductase [Acidimicrobiales bacterium]|nr:LLM class flavin-dependent oxidoreductase [Acidimicrobiales bacterium]